MSLGCLPCNPRHKMPIRSMIPCGFACWLTDRYILTTVTLQQEVQMSGVTAYADEVNRVRSLGFETGDIAKATGAGVGTVSSWARSKRQPSAEFRDRLMELIAIVDRLSRTMDAKYVPLWLNKPLPALGDERPLVALGQGRYRDVSKLVAELEDDSFS